VRSTGALRLGKPNVRKKRILPDTLVSRSARRQFPTSACAPDSRACWWSR
jgi:hypothetical protein